MYKTRKFVLNKFSILSINPNISNAFDEAQVDTLILIAIKKNGLSNNHHYTSNWVFDNNGVYKFKHKIKQSRFSENDGFVIDIEVNQEKKKILSKIRNQSIRIENIFLITRGVNPYDKYRGQTQEVIQSKAYHANFKKDKTFLPELRGKHVSNFIYTWDNKHYISYGDWLAAPRDPKFFKGKRILFREIISSRFICTQIDEDFIIDRSLYIAKPIHNDVNMSAFVGLFSSKLLVWLFRLEKNEFDDLFPKIRLEEFKKLPIPKNFFPQTEIGEKVLQILAIKKSDPSADTTALEAEIDRMVYELYGLTEEEIQIVENASQ